MSGGLQLLPILCKFEEYSYVVVMLYNVQVLAILPVGGSPAQGHEFYRPCPAMGTRIEGGSCWLRESDFHVVGRINSTFLLTLQNKYQEIYTKHPLC